MSASPPGAVIGCDVVGSTALTDFYRGDFSFGPTSGTVTFYLNCGLAGSPDLRPYLATANTVISIADLFLSDGSDIYAIPLFNRSTTNRGDSTAGAAYHANSATAILNSETVLNNPTDIDYRLGYPVWINALEATIAGIGSISMLQDQIVDGNLVRFVVSLNFAYPSGSVLANFFINPNLTVFTATTTAAQDLAPETAVPEPSTWLLTALGGNVL